jgi:ferritin-like metal-binding protein YciE
MRRHQLTDPATGKKLRRGASEPPPQRGVALSQGATRRGDPMAKKQKTLDDLFHETLKDIYYAEKKILTALPKMAKAAQSEELQAAFEKHEGETEGQVERLEKVFALIEQPAKGKTCDAINGIVEEGKEIMKEFRGSAALDAGLLAAAQAVEHYEISRYGTLKTWAKELGLDEAVSLLEETLEEEKKTDEALTELAESAVNQEAQQAAE